MTLEDDINLQRKLMEDANDKFKFAYGVGGAGLVLLLIGWANYGEGALGFLALLGVIGLVIGVYGYFDTKKDVEYHKKKFDELRAVQRDRQARGQG